MKTAIKEKLKNKYQPQWNFRTKASAKKELLWQKRINPDTYRWLMKKDVKVGGKRVPMKEIAKSKIKQKKTITYFPRTFRF